MREGLLVGGCCGLGCGGDAGHSYGGGGGRWVEVGCSVGTVCSCVWLEASLSRWVGGSEEGRVYRSFSTTCIWFSFSFKNLSFSITMSSLSDNSLIVIFVSGGEFGAFDCSFIALRTSRVMRDSSGEV